MNMKKVLVTGAAGFIGAQLSARLMKSGLEVKGIDNFNSHLYDPQLKVDRMKHFGLNIWGCDLADEIKTEALLRDFAPDVIIHLAAHAGPNRPRPPNSDLVRFGRHLRAQARRQALKQKLGTRHLLKKATKISHSETSSVFRNLLRKESRTSQIR